MVKNLPAMVSLLQTRRPGFDPCVGKILWRRECLPIPMLLPGDYHGQRTCGLQSMGYSKELDMTKWLSTQAQTLNMLKRGILQ